MTMEGTERLYKWLGPAGEACNGGTGTWHLPRQAKDGTWKPGKWMPRIANPEPCIKGYHLCRVQDVLRWEGTALYEAEYRGVLKTDARDDKVVVEQARLLRPIPVEVLRLFAADCAERVLHLYEDQYPDDKRPRRAIEAARAYARGEIGAAASAAASAAARDAARDAAWAAASAAQIELLREYLAGVHDPEPVAASQEVEG